MSENRVREENAEEEIRDSYVAALESHLEQMTVYCYYSAKFATTSAPYSATSHLSVHRR